MNEKTADLEVELDNQPGALERLLSILRRRGFEVQYLLVNKNLEGLLIKLRLANLPVGSPNFENLSSHLNNQLSVSRVEIKERIVETKLLPD